MTVFHYGFLLSICIAIGTGVLCFRLMKQNAHLKATRWPRAGEPMRNPNRFAITKPVEKIIK